METQDKAAAYKALQSHDPRFDGLLFVAVRSTGVYCRPICPARTPKLENCEFYRSAAAAQDAGYRPCLRCRPETAPQLAAWRGTSNTVSRAMALISEGALDGDETSVEQLAARLGIGERQLRRLFDDHLGTSPVSVAQTRRVLLAKQLIHDTKLPMTEVAMAAGFSSLRRFNEVFQDLFRRPPSALRREAGKDLAAHQGEVVLHLSYLPPYDWEQMLGFFSARAIEGVEVVENGAYHRSIEVDGELGSIRITHLPEERAIAAAIRFPSLRALPAVVQRIRNMFDLETNIGLIHRHLSSDPMLVPLVTRRPGLRVPGSWHGFEAAVRAVLGQQISVRAARRLASDLALACGTRLPSGHKTHERLTHVFPSAQQVRTATNLRLPMPQSRQRTLTAVAEAAASMQSPFGAGVLIEQAVELLLATPGVGDWTAQYIALRAMRDTDAFPAGDAGLLRGACAVFGTSGLTAKDLRERSERWRPWRAYAAQYLWAADAELGPRRGASGKGEANAIA